MRKTYIIDGYNVIHAAPDLQISVESFGMERARADLVESLGSFARRTGCECVVVFDGIVPQMRSVQGVRVLSSRGRSADDIIREQARQLGQDIVVVSSDHEIVGTARTNLSQVISSKEFAAQIAVLDTRPPAGSAAAHLRPHRIAELRERSEKPHAPDDDDMDEWKKLFGV